MDWSKYLADISQPGRGLVFSTLIRLSNLTSVEAQGLAQAWPALRAERRYQLMARLAELAEENIELNFDEVFRLGLDDRETQVKLKAMEGLFESEDPTLIPALLRLLKEDGEAAVQAAAAIALGKFVLLVELDKLHSKQARAIADDLLTVLNQEGRAIEVKRRALEAVAPLSQPKVGAEIEKAYHSPEPLIRLGAIYAMGRNCDLRWLSLLVNELSSPLSEMRYEAAQACGELAEADAVPHLLPLFKDEDETVRLAAIQALGRIGGPQAKAVLTQLAEEGDTVLKEAAQEALEELLGDEEMDEG